MKSIDGRPSLVIYEGTDEWSGLYADGELVEVGDHYVINEKAFALAHIEVIQSDDYMQGGRQRGEAAPTLNDVHAYADTRKSEKARAAQLRLRAADLLEQAQNIEDIFGDYSEGRHHGK